MNLAYRWLQEYVTTTIPAKELAEKFRMTSSESEGVSQPFSIPESVVVGYTKNVEKHPNADKLHVVQVDTGDQVRTIVCGAPNVAKGQYVIVALPGTTLTTSKGSITIEKATLRGVESHGMLCSEGELGLPIESIGILVLEKPIEPGTPAIKALGLDDWVIDLEITPNRPDLLSYYGLAREVSAFEHTKLRDIQIATLDDSSKLLRLLEAKVDDQKLCPRISLISVKIDQIVASPWWMQSRLLLAGVRPINAVVDVTNYVMLELGQPMHAYDRTKIAAGGKKNCPQIIVRSAKSGEEIQLLDESSRKLEKNDIVITDGAGKLLGLGGIMGGEQSGVSSTTTEIIFEAATFSAAQIRRTSRRLGLRSEASLRFEKGLDPELTVKALKRAIYLLSQICPVTVTSKLIDAHSQTRKAHQKIHVPFSKIQQFLGVHISAAECKAILTKLGFQLSSFTKSSFDATPPSWRADVLLVEDVLEELIRIWGYDRIPSTMLSGPITTPCVNQDFASRYKIHHSLAAQGWFGCVSQPFTSEADLKLFNVVPSEALVLPNPLSRETAYLIPNHTILLVQSFSGSNSDQLEARLYEMGSVFSPPHREDLSLTLVQRSQKPLDEVYQQVKGAIIRLVQDSGRTELVSFTATRDSQPYFDPDYTLNITVGGQVLGQLGCIRLDILEKNKIRRAQTVVAAEINLKKLLSLHPTTRRYTLTNSLPAVERDLTLILNNGTRYDDIDSTVRTFSNPDWLEGWQLKDIYEGEPLPKGKKSVTLHFTYRASDRSLTNEEVNDHLNELTSFACKQLSATVNQ